MKKLKLMILFLIFTVILVGCNTNTTIDLVPPNLSGTKDITYAIGSTEPDYLDGVTAIDIVDGDVTNSIIVDDSDVDLTTPGTYLVIYIVSDTSGNGIQRLISIIVEDRTPPEIFGANDLTYYIGDTEPNYLQGITATDNLDGDITNLVTVDDTSVDLFLPGSYTLTYSVTDTSGNDTQLSVSIMVIDDGLPEILGTEDLIYNIGDSIPDYLNGVSATDNADGDITDLIIVDDSNVNLTLLGTYSLTYSVTDIAGNESQVTVSVTVVDNTPPEILGTSDIIYYLGDDEPDYLSGISAIDNLYGNVTYLIVVDDSNVVLTAIGNYTLTYSITDLSGNTNQISVSIFVEDGTRPIISGTNDLIYYLGDTEPDYLDGVSAMDNVDGNITDLIIVDDSDVDLSIVGVYDVIYTVSDQADNILQVTIQLTVIDPSQLLNPDYLNIYYINDFHGAILENGDQMGLSHIGNLILNEKSVSPMNTLFIGGGDILQGSLLSNYFYGSSTMDILNQMQLDAFTIGNHEFDWGFDIIQNFRDPSFDGIQADFPLLGANIFLEGTTTRPDHVDAYTIIEKGNLKIGIIGVMGLGLEYSIATSKITGYYFDNPVYWTAYYAEQLRTVEGVDVVLAVVHDNGVSSGYNQSMSALTGNQRIDAVFNGHSHSTYAQYITRTGVRLPYIQSGSTGTSVGKVTLELDEFQNVTNAYAVNLDATSDVRLTQNNAEIDAVINTYYAEVEPLITEPIITSGAYMSTSTLTFYMAKLIRMSSDSDIGFHNSGGTRAPLTNGQIITLGTLYQIFPFDNKIKTTYLLGSQINAFKNSSYGSYYSTREPDMIFEDNVYYKVATNDYMFDSPSNPFIYGTDSVDTGILIRDVLENVLRNQKADGYDFFYLNNPIVLSSLPNLEFVLQLNKEEQLYI